MINTEALDVYTSLRARILTGSIALFSGNGRISTGIRVGQFAAGHPWDCARWSHVGLLYREPLSGQVMLLESTTLSNHKDLLTGVPREGVQMVNFSTRLATYDGYVGIRIPTIEPTEAELEALGLAILRFKGAPYEQHRIDLVTAVLDRLGEGDNLEDVSSLFCSEFVAELYQAMGWLPEWEDNISADVTHYLGQDLAVPTKVAHTEHNRPSDEWVPADFARPCLKLAGRSLALPLILK